MLQEKTILYDLKVILQDLRLLSVLTFVLTGDFNLLVWTYLAYYVECGEKTILTYMLWKPERSLFSWVWMEQFYNSQSISLQENWMEMRIVG